MGWSGGGTSSVGWWAGSFEFVVVIRLDGSFVAGAGEPEVSVGGGECDHPLHVHRQRPAAFVDEVVVVIA